MSAQQELEKFRRLLSVAQAEVQENRPDAAMELLRPVTALIESREGTLEWVELPLVTGHALAAKKDEAAEAYLKQALGRVVQVHDPPPDLEIRIYKQLGNFYRQCVHRRATAREFYMKAKQVADCAGFLADSDKLEIRIRGIDLENDNDPLYGDFSSLVAVGRREGFTAKEQLEVWQSYYATAQTNSKTLKAARSFGSASEKYFLKLLTSKRNEKK